jgi:septal ring factor EnvC (AmiA/AmiB activator)
MERGTRSAKAAFISIAVAITLAGCDDTRALRNRAEAAEQKLAQLQKRLDEAEREVTRTREYRRAAAVAQACDRPLVWRVCPAHDLELGRAALAAGYTADQAVYWSAMVGLLAALCAALASAAVSAYVLWLRIAAPAEKDVESARRLVESAKDQAQRWQLQAQESQRAAQTAAAELERLRAQKERLKTELSSLQAELEQTQRLLDALRGFS